MADADFEQHFQCPLDQCDGQREKAGSISKSNHIDAADNVYRLTHDISLDNLKCPQDSDAMKYELNRQGRLDSECNVLAGIEQKVETDTDGNTNPHDTADKRPVAGGECSGMCAAAAGGSGEEEDVPSAAASLLWRHYNQLRGAGHGHGHGQGRGKRVRGTSGEYDAPAAAAPPPPPPPPHHNKCAAASPMSMSTCSERSLADEILECQGAALLTSDNNLLQLGQSSVQATDADADDSTNGNTLTAAAASSTAMTASTTSATSATHRGLYRFIPRHDGELEIDVGDLLHVHNEGDDLWCEGINLRTGHTGIFPFAYACDIDYDAMFDPESNKPCTERFVMKFLGSVEVTCHKGNEVLCQAMSKIAQTRRVTLNSQPPQMCVLEINQYGIRMVDKTKHTSEKFGGLRETLGRMFGRSKASADSGSGAVASGGGQYDHFFALKNISFCGYHPKNHRYFGFITKHPVQSRFACHVFIGERSSQSVAEAVGRAFRGYYEDFRHYTATSHPTEDIYME